ncbi:hypothetical protein Tco_0925751 [Tanacetum coccineum]|uniref:Retrovirus-related Pol polyprotein from transposon TNT 1-94 n=1 Tax=Tanacetum coccineum TaxID=301880 RepID=A0ABQ5D923_9ASTR
MVARDPHRESRFQIFGVMGNLTAPEMWLWREGCYGYSGVMGKSADDDGTRGYTSPPDQTAVSKRKLMIVSSSIHADDVDHDDIMKSVISCETAKDTWTDLVHSFEGPSYTKENRIMDLKLEYQTFRAKPNESLSQTYTCYKTLLNELANDGVNLSKHEINVGFVNSLPEKWLTFSQGLRNANHTQTLDLADIYERFDFQENSDDEVDDRSSEEYLRDLDIEFHERALLANSKRFIKRRNNFSVTGYSLKDYKAEYKKMKAKLALLEASPSTSQTPMASQPKNKGLVAETFDWDEEEASDDEEVTQVKVLMALADDELAVGKIMLEMLNHALQEQLKEEKKINEKLLTSSIKVSQCISEQIPHQKKKVLGGELLTESSSKMNENENLFVPASLGYDQEMVPKSKDWVERLNPDSKLPNFNTGRILVLESQAVNESLKPTDPESSKDSKVESLTPLPPLKIL